MKRDDRAVCAGAFAVVGESKPTRIRRINYEKVTRHIPLDDTGNALSFALKLKNKNNGTNQTHNAKNVAMSWNAGACALPRSCKCKLPRKDLFVRIACASLEILEK